MTVRHKEYMVVKEEQTYRLHVQIVVATKGSNLEVRVSWYTREPIKSKMKQ